MPEAELHGFSLCPLSLWALLSSQKMLQQSSLQLTSMTIASDAALLMDHVCSCVTAWPSKKTSRGSWWLLWLWPSASSASPATTFPASPVFGALAVCLLDFVWLLSLLEHPHFLHQSLYLLSRGAGCTPPACSYRAVDRFVTQSLKNAKPTLSPRFGP